jgi:capsular polysaccharide biosynthesis protein
MASLLFSVAVGFGLESIDPVLVTSEQVEALSELPVLGSVSHMS